MALKVNLRHLEAGNVRLKGELPIEELDIETGDEMIKGGSPLKHDLEVQRVEGGLLVQGQLQLVLQCRCVRCLKGFERRLKLENWTRHLPLQGEEAAPVDNDCVDLTPFIREDMLLEFPQHPLCKTECGGLPGMNQRGRDGVISGGQPEEGSPAWNELNKLKF
jgi:uncharacterized metal-binding protein YceD (DUF177 family)